MPRTEDYYPFEAATPEPRLIPGYTGYLPGYGPRRIYQMANTYGQMTHNIMSVHPIAGLRLKPILGRSDVVAKEDDDQFRTWQHECTTNDVKLRNFMVPGYAGYVPRKIFSIGKGLNLTTQESVGQFVRLQEKKVQFDEADRYLKSSMLKWPLPDKNPHVRKETVAPYTSYLNVLNYARNPMLDTSKENRYKEFEPGQFNKTAEGPMYPELLPRYLKGYSLRKYLPDDMQITTMHLNT